jgi:hypothetical protein
MDELRSPVNSRKHLGRIATQVFLADPIGSLLDDADHQPQRVVRSTMSAYSCVRSCWRESQPRL